MAACPDCKAELPAKAVACPRCGRSLGDKTVMGLPADAVAALLKGGASTTGRQRIDALAEGWGVPSSAPAPDPAPAPKPLPPAEPSAAVLPGPPPAHEPTPAMAHEDKPVPVPVPTGESGRTVLELPSFAEGKPPRGLLDSVLYTARALRLLARRRVRLRRLRLIADEKQRARVQRLCELGEAAFALRSSGESGPLEAARPKLQALEEQIAHQESERGSLIAAVAAEERDAASAAQEHVARGRELQARVDELEARIRPLTAELKTQERRVRDAEQSLTDLAQKMAALEARRNSGDASEQAEVATKLAAVAGERDRAQRTLPEANATVQELGPRIEQLKVEHSAARSAYEANRREETAREQKKRETLTTLDQRRAASEAALARLRDDRLIALRELGEKLDRERLSSPDLFPRYRALDELGGALTGIEFQMAELSREAGAIDRRAIMVASGALAASLVLLSLLVAWIF